jgi:hypothetical protein
MREISSPLDGFASPFGPQRGFNPLRLFSNGEPGAWFEANDANTLFTDVAGTTPVTTPGDAVALQLDKSQGLTLGPDTVDFAVLGDQGTGWVKEDGIIKKISDDATLYDFGASVEAGKYYEITLTKLNHTVGNPSITVGGNSYSGIISFEDPDGTYTFILQATGSGTVTVAANAARIWLSAFSVRELPGNHRTQATVAARPLYALHPVGGVRNLLQYTEEFDNAFWVKTTATVAANASAAPNGTTTADKLIATAVSGQHKLNANSVSGSGTHSFSIYAKPAGYSWIILQTAGGFAWFDVSTGTIGTQTGVTGLIEPADGGFFRCTIVESVTTTIGTPTVWVTNGNGVTSFIGDGTSGVYIWGAQLEQGSTATNYQRVGSFLDVSEEGKARRGRIWYNGTSHFMQTGTITPGTDKVQVFAGVRKLSDAAAGILIESSTISETSNGAFGIAAPGSSTKFIAISRGTIIRTAGTTSAAYNAPTTRVVSAFSDISGDRVALHIDGTQVAQSTESQGTGNYLAYPIYFGARAGTSLFYNGYEDTSIIRFGPNLDDTTISKVESYVASKTPASELLIPAGPELVTNGTFDTDVSGWDADANGTISWDNGTLKYTGTGAGPTFMDASQTLSTIVGQRYRVSFELTALSPTNPIRCVVTGTSDVITVNDSGVAVGDFIATNTSTLFQIGIVGGVLGETFNIDNVSVRQFIPK